jgi:hypothetical protein
MTGNKYKIAHKRANKEKWSATDQTQKRYMIKILQEMIKEIEAAPEEETTVEQAKGKEKKVARQTQLIPVNP